ncbi:histidine kinase [uncultured Arcticibacterium sp.]|uniref:histidine kinase n=1 Tax=uncultured Arcticibacterium sp. TaxID=2173042 RepID=UPI0030F6F0FC
MKHKKSIAKTITSYLRRTLILFSLLIAFPTTADAQIGDTLLLSSDFSKQNIRGTALFTEQNQDTSLEEIRSSDTKWQILDAYKTASSGKSAIWLYLPIKNNSPEEQTLYFRDWLNDEVHLFKIEANGNKQEFISGQLKYNSAQTDLQKIDYITTKIKPQETLQIYIQIKPVYGYLGKYNPLPQKPVIAKLSVGSENKLNQTLRGYYEHNIKEVQLRNIYQGALILITFVALFFMLKSPKSLINRYYFLYVFCALAYSLIQSRGYTFIGQGIQNFPYIKKYGQELFFWLGVGFYFKFAISLLLIRSKKPKWYKFVNKSVLVIWVFSILQFIFLLLTNNNYYSDLIVYNKIPLIVFYFWFLVYTYRRIEGPLVKYILIGNAMLFFFALCAWLKDLTASQNWGEGILNHMFSLPLAVLFEVIVFSFAMAVRQKLDSENALKAERKIIETEMLALRSQMNPHFVFNSLNSIRNLVLKNENEKAITYLSRFSKLVRTILQQTQKQIITLAEELDTLQQYVDSEADRLDAAIDFKIINKASNDALDLDFPPMLLQPIVENAIWHGLRPSKKENKHIRLTINEPNDAHLQIIIKDNGIGRKESAKAKQNQNSARISMGSEITKKRLELFNEQGNSKISLTIQDLENGAGTVVVLDYLI